MHRVIAALLTVIAAVLLLGHGAAGTGASPFTDALQAAAGAVASFVLLPRLTVILLVSAVKAWHHRPAPPAP